MFEINLNYIRKIQSIKLEKVERDLVTIRNTQLEKGTISPTEHINGRHVGYSCMDLF